MVGIRHKVGATVFAVVGMIAVVALVGAFGPSTGTTGDAGFAPAGGQAGTGTGTIVTGARTAMGPREIGIATTVAFREAESSIPGADGTPRSAAPSHSTAAGDGITWPSNVSEVAALASTRGRAEVYVGAAVTMDATPVVVVQLIGDFAVVTSGPPPVVNPSASGSPAPDADSSANGNWARGQVMTVVADASSGQVLDFGLEPSSDPAISLPSPQVIYQR